jgi:phosphotriesterase-related protein
VRALVDAGFGGRILLSQDVCLRTDLHAMGGPGYTYVTTTFAGLLVAAGLPAELVTSLMVDNPRRALTGEAV